MTACTKPDLRVYRHGDEEAILALFNRVFARVDPTFAPRSLAAWRRLFLENPDGHRIALAVDDEGRVVAQYAGQGRRVRLGDREVAASVAVDSVSDPRARSGLGREGAFVAAGRLFAERFGGPEPERDAFMWGLPERAAWRLGHKFLGYDTVCNPKWLVLAAGRSAAGGAAAPGDLEAPGASTSLDVVELQHFPPALDGLFERAAAAHGALALRDARRLAWRFGGDERVRIAIARGRADAGPGAGAAGAAGYVVARPGVIDGHRGLIVCDWLVARGEARSEAHARAALQSWIRRATLRLGLECAVCALPETSREWLEFQRAGWRVRPSRFRLVARCYRPELSVDWLRRHWYWTLADTDLV